MDDKEMVKSILGIGNLVLPTSYYGDFAKIILVGMGLTDTNRRLKRILRRWIKQNTDLDPDRVPAYNKPISEGSLFRGVGREIWIFEDGDWRECEIVPKRELERIRNDQ